jgi:3-deoxy-D-manno-octulosonate 8-phosphate phosphatase (KDO 8-P phosphatase)
MHLEQNIKGLCAKFGVDFNEFLNDLNADNVLELSMFDLQAICEEYEVDLHSLLFKPMYKPEKFRNQLAATKLLILDVDGVLTDGGMYVSENGDQQKRFHTHDGMGLLHLAKIGVEVGIISSGFTSNIVQSRAALLGIQKCYVGREPKLTILQEWCTELGIELSNVAIIGDDINDLEIMKNVGLAVCPANAVNAVKSQSHIILTKKGGDGCVRESIDTYLLKEPIH